MSLGPSTEPGGCMDAESPQDKQGEFFNRARRDGGPVTIYLTNGKKLIGRIRSFDRFTVVLESNRVEQLIFKHAISTVSAGRLGGGRPARPDTSPRRPAPPAAPPDAEPAPPPPSSEEE